MFMFIFNTHKELKNCNKMLNPLMWEQLRNIYCKDEEKEFVLY